MKPETFAVFKIQKIAVRIFPIDIIDEARKNE